VPFVFTNSQLWPGLHFPGYAERSVLKHPWLVSGQETFACR